MHADPVLGVWVLAEQLAQSGLVADQDDLQVGAAERGLGTTGHDLPGGRVATHRVHDNASHPGRIL